MTQTAPCQSLIKRFCTDSFSDKDVEETLDVGEFVTVEVHQEHGGTGPAGAQLDAGLGFSSGAHIADAAGRRAPRRIVIRDGQRSGPSQTHRAHLCVTGLPSVRPTPSRVKLQSFSGSGKEFTKVSSAVSGCFTRASPTSCRQARSSDVRSDAIIP